jgi:cytochrome c-type biogenesis protein CcmH/NrfG
VHAKWAFVLLALVFGLGFVFLGIGSGSNGITDALQNAFNFGKSGGGTSISSLERKTQKHPLDAQAWRDLATAYETKQRTNDAIIALSQYVGLRSKDADALAELASEYGQQANQYAQDYQATLQSASVLTPPFAAFPPAASSPFGKALNDPKALQDPISASLRAQAQSAQQTALSNYQGAQKNAEQTYQKLVKLTPDDPNAQYQLGQAADAAADTKVALAAYRAVVKLVPQKTDPLRAAADQRIKALAPAPKKTKK